MSEKMWRRDNGFDSMTTPPGFIQPPEVTAKMLQKIESNPELKEALLEANRIRRRMMEDAGEKPNNIGWVHNLQKQAKKDDDSDMSAKYEKIISEHVTKEKGKDEKLVASINDLVSGS